MRLFGKKEIANETTDPGGYLLTALMGPARTITRETALEVPAVAKAVDKICNTVAGLPVKLYRDVGGKVEEIPDDYRVELLNGETGDTMGAGQVRRAMAEDYLLSKGGFSVVEWSRNKIDGIYYVKSENVAAEKGTDPVHKAAAYVINGKTYKDYEILKILRNTRDGVVGESVISEISKAIETVYENMLYQLMLVRTGGNKKGFLTSENRLAPETVDKLRESWRKLYSASNENIVVLNKGIKFQESSNSNVEMQLNETQARFGVEIDKIFQISDDDSKFLKYGIMPIVTQFENAYNRYLLLESEKETYYFAFDTTELTRGNLAERYAAYHTALSDGWLSRNEVRYAENREKVEGLDTYNLSLGAVLYDPEAKTYFTPNTKEVTSGTGAAEPDPKGGEGE